MLRLENVSKFYSSGGMVSTGFSKVNLEFKMGEFVAITGESGSGKSTLLNVISGLDSYEEGEMFIMGKPTSGFSRGDLEDYRKEYIGNIFQSFNLINSYTVYQNVELILLMSGYRKDEVKSKVKEIIAKVGLSEYEKAKASKLSGGQKQRVAIARALAKETPIIVADEPTGNLDSKSAAEIIELLHELSKEKLIIIVTHNYEQVEKYVTRKISMHDGRVAEDKHFTEELNTNIEAVPGRADSLSFGNMTRLSARNTFNIPAKFLLLLIVFLFLCSGTIAQYSSYLNIGDATSDSGYNSYFVDTSRERVLVTKADKSAFTDEDYDKLSSIDNVDRIVKNDLSLDISAGLLSESEDDGFYISTAIADADKYEPQLIEGRMPENASEAILIFDNSDEYVSNELIGKYSSAMKLNNDYTGLDLLSHPVTIVGYGYATEEQVNTLHSGQAYQDAIVGLNEDGMNDLRASSLERYCSQEIAIGKSIIAGNSGQGMYMLKTSEQVPAGKLYIPEDIGNLVEYPTGKDITITNKSLYFTDTFEYKVAGVYTSKNLKATTGYTDYDMVAGSIFMNPADYATMFNKGNYQSSVMLSDTKLASETVAAIQDAGYETFKVSDSVSTEGQTFTVISNIMRTILLVIVLVVLFFITYFITKLVLKSRNTYYSTIRMIGGTKENCSSMLRTELFIVFNIAYFVCVVFAAIVNQGLINSDYLIRVISFLEFKDYIILYVLLCLMSLLLASRYARQLFKKTAMNAYTEEV